MLPRIFGYCCNAWKCLNKEAHECSLYSAAATAASWGGSCHFEAAVAAATVAAATNAAATNAAATNARVAVANQDGAASKRGRCLIAAAESNQRPGCFHSVLSCYGTSQIERNLRGIYLSSCASGKGSSNFPKSAPAQCSKGVRFQIARILSSC